MQESEKPKIKLSELSDLYDIEDDSNRDGKKSIVQKEGKTDLDIEIEIEDGKLEVEFDGD